MDSDQRRESREVTRITDTPAWAWALFKLGVPAVIAIYVVHVLSTGVLADLRDVRDTVHEHSAQAQQLRADFDYFREQQQEYSMTLLAIEQRICLNTANDGVERQACLNPEPHPVVSHAPGGGK